MGTIDYIEDGVLIQIDESDGRNPANTKNNEPTDAESLAIKTAGLAEILRRKRNRLLADTDWMATGDRSISDEWRTYRQALRDLPETTKDKWPYLEDSDWPTKPS